MFRPVIMDQQGQAGLAGLTRDGSCALLLFGVDHLHVSHPRPPSLLGVFRLAGGAKAPSPARSWLLRERGLAGGSVPAPCPRAWCDRERASKRHCKLVGARTCRRSAGQCRMWLRTRTQLGFQDGGVSGVVPVLTNNATLRTMRRFARDGSSCRWIRCGRASGSPADPYIPDRWRARWGPCVGSQIGRYRDWAEGFPRSAAVTGI